jgi:hypothetical protein
MLFKFEKQFSSNSKFMKDVLGLIFLEFFVVEFSEGVLHLH